MLDVVIIGAGLAGLSAARWLNDKGIRVLVLEKEYRLGGRVWTREWRGGERGGYEQGAQFFSHHFGMVRKLAKSRNVPLLPVPFSLRMRVGKEWKDARYDQWGLLLNLPGVPWNVRHQLVRLVWDAKKHSGNDRDLEEYAKRFHLSIYEYIIAPFYQTLFFSHPSGVSTHHFLAHFGLPPSQRIYRPQGGMSRFVEELARDIPVRTGIKVQKVESAGDSVCVSIQTENGIEQLRARYVLLAVPGNQVLLLTDSGEFSPEVADILRTIQYAGTAVVSIRMKETGSISNYGFSVPPKYGSILSGGVINNNETWNVMLTADAYQALHQKTDGQLMGRVAEELGRLMPESRAHFQEMQIWRWATAIPRFRPGFVEKVSRLSNQWRSFNNRVHLAGDYLDLGCTEGAVRSGILAAERIVALLRSDDD